MKYRMHQLNYRYYLWILCMIWISSGAYGQDTKMVRTVEKTFSVSALVQLDISNKYGNIVVHPGPSNEVKVSIELIAFGKDDETTKKLMDRVEFDFSATKDYVTIESVFDRSTGFVAEMMKTIGDYSKSLLSKNKLQVNYDVTIPENSSLTLTNKFGDIYLQDFTGKCNITIAHGDMRCGDLNQYSRIEHNYGTLRAKSINDAQITLKGAELDVDKAAQLRIYSNSSQIHIGSVESLYISSTNDKIEVNSLNTMQGKADFSNISVNLVQELADVDQNYGGLLFSDVKSGFKELKLNGKSTDYHLIISQPVNAEVNLEGREDKMRLPIEWKDLEKMYIDEKSKEISLKGNVGKTTDSAKSEITVKSGTGDIIIELHK